MSATGGTWNTGDVATAQAMNYKTLALQTGAPVSPIIGQLWFDNSVNLLKIWNGTVWSPQLWASTDDYIIYKAGSTYKALGNSLLGYAPLSNSTPDLGALFNAVVSNLPVMSNGNIVGSVGILSSSTAYTATTKMSKPGSTVLHGSGAGVHIVGPTNDWTLEVPNPAAPYNGTNVGAIRDLLLDGNANTGALGGLHLVDGGATQVVDNVFAISYNGGVGFCVEAVSSFCEHYFLRACQAHTCLTGLYLKSATNTSFEYGTLIDFQSTIGSALAGYVGIRVGAGTQFGGCNWNISSQIAPSASVSHTGFVTDPSGALQAPQFNPQNSIIVVIENLGTHGYGIGYNFGSNLFMQDQSIASFGLIGNAANYATPVEFGNGAATAISEGRIGYGGKTTYRVLPFSPNGYPIMEIWEDTGTNLIAQLLPGTSGQTGILGVLDNTKGATAYYYSLNGVWTYSATRPA